MKNKHSNQTVAGRVPLVTVSLTKRSNKDRPVGTLNYVVMKTTATISQVRGYFKNEMYSLRIQMSDAVIPCYRYDDKGELVEDKTDTLYLPTNVVLAQLANADARFGQWFASRRDKAIGTKEHPFAPSVAETVLTGATLEIESTKHSAGEEYTASDGSVGHYNSDGYNNAIVSVKFVADIDAALNKYIPKDRSEVISDLF